MNINFWKGYFPVLYNFVWKQLFSTVVKEHFRALRKAKPWLALRSQAFGGVRHVISGFQKQLFLPNVDVVGNFQGRIANTAVTRGAGCAITPYGCLCSFSCKWTRSGGVVCARIQACHWSVFVKQPLENVTTGEAEKQQRLRWIQHKSESLGENGCGSEEKEVLPVKQADQKQENPIFLVFELWHVFVSFFQTRCLSSEWIFPDIFLHSYVVQHTYWYIFFVPVWKSFPANRQKKKERGQEDKRETKRRYLVYTKKTGWKTPKKFDVKNWKQMEIGT